MEYTDKARGADMMRLVFRNNDLELFDHASFTHGKKLAVLFGYPGQTYGTGPVEMTVTKVSGFNELTIEGPAAGTARFLGSQRTRSWETATEWEVAADIAESMGYPADVQDVSRGDLAEVRRGITQAGETDWAFLQRLAARVGCSCFLSDGVFHFHPPALDTPPSKEVVYFDSETGQDAGGYPRLEYSTLGRGGRSTRRGYSTRNREEVTGTAGNDDDTGRPVLGDEACAPDPGSWEDRIGATAEELREADARVQAQEEVGPTNAETDEEAERDARRSFRAAERDSIKLEWELIGDPEMVADQNLRISGIGARFSGVYHLDEVVHAIKGSYRTTIKASRNATTSSGASASRRVSDRMDDSDTGEATGHLNDEPVTNPYQWEHIFDEAGDE